MSEDKPGLAVIIASKRKKSSDDSEDGDRDEGKVATEMAEEILDSIKSGPKELGKSLMNFVRYFADERE